MTLLYLYIYLSIYLPVYLVETSVVLYGFLAAVFSHGPGVGLGRLPRLPPPTCARPVSGAGLGPSLLPGFTAVVSRPPPVASFSLCALRLFVIKRTYSRRRVIDAPLPLLRGTLLPGGVRRGARGLAEH